MADAAMRTRSATRASSYASDSLSSPGIAMAIASGALLTYRAWTEISPICRRTSASRTTMNCHGGAVREQPGPPGAAPAPPVDLPRRWVPGAAGPPGDLEDGVEVVLGDRLVGEAADLPGLP